MSERPTMWTVGHGTASAAAFASLMVGAGVGVVADVRRYPGSRKNPQYRGDDMAAWLAASGIGYRWMQGLGGRRRPIPDSPNFVLRNPQFRAYADYMATEGFAVAVRELVDVASSTPTAAMCSESVWWRCHRRLLADHLVLVENVAVEHIFHDGRLAAHPVTEGARRAGDHVVYDVVGSRDG